MRPANHNPVAASDLTCDQARVPAVICNAQNIAQPPVAVAEVPKFANTGKDGRVVITVDDGAKAEAFPKQPAIFLG